ncbi:MAG: (Fe-S)-binding protein [Elusimicrobia bacterium]|nr:(Fe-S)-binding protein [Elusimicrobiota bacterium]
MSGVLGRLLTALGERSCYDAVSQCSRCGYCEQACPTYVASGREPQSPRGRNQLARLLLEGKFEDPLSAREALSTCLLCGACTSVCPAHVPTADIVLEGRRELSGTRSAWLRKALHHLFVRSPDILAILIRAGYALKRSGLSRLAARSGLLRLIGLRALAEADAHVQETPKRLLFEMLREDTSLKEDRAAAWRYFASCGPNFVFPRVGLATIRILKRACGRGSFFDGRCCGLTAYNYGDLDTARALARMNIERLESLRGEAPLIADCSSCAAFLKSYPQLFLREADWRARAERFAARVRDVVEISPSLPKDALREAFALHDCCRARHGQGLSQQPRRALQPACARWRELPESDVCCGGAGLFAFKHPGLSEAILRRKVSDIAASQARAVAVSGTSCLIQLARGLKKYYPECRVVHWSEAVCEALDHEDG